MKDHAHDWRVDPSQVIIMLRDENRVRVVCGDKRCGAVAVVFSKPSPAIELTKPETWRPFQFKKGDYIRIEPDLLGRK